MIVEVNNPSGIDSLSALRDAKRPSGDGQRRMQANREAMLLGAKDSLDASEALRVAKQLKELEALNEPVFNGCTALGLACKFNDEALARALLAEGADARAASRSGASPIMETIAALSPFMGASRDDLSRWRGCLEALMAFGADVGHQDNEGRQAIHFATGLSGTEVIEWLLANGANPSAADNKGFTPLLQTARTGEMDFVRILIQSGADVFAKCSPGGGAEPLDAVGMAKSWGIVFEDPELLALLLGAQQALREKAALSAATPKGRAGSARRRI